MRKILIKKTNDKYNFYENEDFLFSVELSNKTIDGRDIYEKIYKGIEVSSKIVTEIDISELTGDDKKTFGNYIVELFKELDSAINAKFNH